MSVSFVFTNPGHHLEMMSPVAAELATRGIDCELVSLAEFRGFDTPRDDARLRRVIPVNVRRRRRAPAHVHYGEGEVAPLGRGGVAKYFVWQLLRHRLRQLLHGARVVVVPNDSAYPYFELLRDLQGVGVSTILMQEGIRFALPAGYSQRNYGGGGTAAICAWGEGSRDYFLKAGAPAESVMVTGAPRFDALDRAHWRARGEAMLARLGLAAPIAFLSNPIETAGYGTKQQKLDLFARFLDESARLVRASHVPIVVKHHMHERSDDFVRVAAASPIADYVHVIDAPVFAVLAVARAAVILSSTVGLEALMFGVPIAQLEIPNHGFVFEYVHDGAAVPLREGSIFAGLEALLEDSNSRRAAASALLERHVCDRGRARINVANVIEAVLRDA